MNTTRKLNLKLKPKERQFLKTILKKGEHSARVLTRARILCMLDEGYSSNQIAPILHVTPETARRKGWLYVRHGLKRALYEAKRPGGKRVINDTQTNQLIALACSQPPEGCARWSIRLIMEEALKRCILKKKISPETVRLMFHQHKFKPWREKNVVYSYA